MNENPLIKILQKFENEMLNTFIDLQLGQELNRVDNTNNKSALTKQFKTMDGFGTATKP